MSGEQGEVSYRVAENDREGMQDYNDNDAMTAINESMFYSVRSNIYSDGGVMSVRERAELGGWVLKTIYEHNPDVYPNVFPLAMEMFDRFAERDENHLLSDPSKRHTCISTIAMMASYESGYGPLRGMDFFDETAKTYIFNRISENGMYPSFSPLFAMFNTVSDAEDAVSNAALAVTYMCMLVPSVMNFGGESRLTSNPTQLGQAIAAVVFGVTDISYGAEFMVPTIKRAFDQRNALVGVRDIFTFVFPNVTPSMLASCEATCTTAVTPDPLDEPLSVYATAPQPVQVAYAPEAAPAPVVQQPVDASVEAIAAANASWQTAATYGLGSDAVFKNRYYNAKTRAMALNIMVAAGGADNATDIGNRLNLLDRYMMSHTEYQNPNQFADELALSVRASETASNMMYEDPSRLTDEFVSRHITSTFPGLDGAQHERMLMRTQSMMELANGATEPPTVPSLVSLLSNYMYATWKDTLTLEEYSARENRAARLACLTMMFPSLVAADGVSVALSVLSMSGFEIAESSHETNALVAAALCAMRISDFCRSLKAMQVQIVQPLENEQNQLHFAACYVEGFKLTDADASLVL